MNIKELGGVCVSRKPLATQMVWTPPINQKAEDLYQYKDYYYKLTEVSSLTSANMLQNIREFPSFKKPSVDTSTIGVAMSDISKLFDSLPSKRFRNYDGVPTHFVSKEVIEEFRKHSIKNHPGWYKVIDNIVHVDTYLLLQSLQSLPNHDESR